jgi:uncharacterized protein DUF1592/uncharacterized protein DUF1588/uncharacterized protein DUF1595/uncharacterized protein DUF1587/uncharacterized protein DUF1585
MASLRPHGMLLVLGVAVGCAAAAGACSPGAIGTMQGSSGVGGGGSSGSVPGMPGTGGSTGSSPGGTTMIPLGTPDCVAGMPNPGRSPLRRLSLTEYATTVKALLGVDTSSVLSTFPPDQVTAGGLGFSNNADALEVSALLANAYMTAAETFATTATAAANLPTLLGCNPTAGDACAQQFITSFGLRAFRRPLTAAENTTFFNLYKTGSTAPEGSVFADGISLAIEAFLQSPNFLYRVEKGVPATPTATVAPLSDFEMATRLSYFFWGTSPTVALLNVAQAGQLHTAAQVAAEVKVMMADPQARVAVANFHSEWLNLSAISGLGKDPTMFPSSVWNTSIAGDLAQEATTFVDQVFWGDGRSDTLFEASYSYVNDELATFYGLQPPGSGTAAAKVAFDPTQRAGLLTLGGILATNAKPNQTSPVLRGKFVREQLLCGTVPPPPANLVITVPQVTPGSTTRQRFAQHEVQTLCSSCHVLMDGMGLGFEHYDPLGRWRDMDQGLPIDDSGQVAGPTDIDGPFNGAIELSKKFIQSEDVRQCVVKQWFRYANGRTETVGPATGASGVGPINDNCTLERLDQSFEASAHNMPDLLVQIATSDAFLYRSMQGGGQ